MITERPVGWAKNAIAGLGNPVYWRSGACRHSAGSRRPVPLIEVLWPATTTVHGLRKQDAGHWSKSGLCATFEGSLTTTMARIILGSGQGNKHEANDE